jgi:hypothetical protein
VVNQNRQKKVVQAGLSTLGRFSNIARSLFFCIFEKKTALNDISTGNGSCSIKDC